MLTLTIDNPAVENAIKAAAEVQRKTPEGLLVDAFAVIGLGDTRFSYDRAQQQELERDLQPA